MTTATFHGLTGAVALTLALGLAAAGATARAADSLESRAVAEARVESAAKPAQVVVTVKGRDPDLYVNKEYGGLRCTVAMAGDGKLARTEVAKADVVWDDAPGKPGKAKAATFRIAVDKGPAGAVTGECKVVVCTDAACSSPFKLPLQSK